jgi:hypothetical protein
VTDDQLLEKGTKAEQAKEYLEGLIKEATDRLSEQLLNLYPDETIKFSVIRSQMMSLHDILLVVEADIREGQNALERIQNPVAEQKGGIL